MRFICFVKGKEMKVKSQCGRLILFPPTFSSCIYICSDKQTDRRTDSWAATPSLIVLTPDPTRCRKTASQQYILQEKYNRKYIQFWQK